LTRVLVRRLRAGFLLVLLPIVLVACTLESGGFIISLPVNVRVLNALVDGGSLNLTVDNDALVTGLPFEGLTPYNEVDAGLRTLTISVAGGTSTIAETTTLLIDATDYTYLVFGTSSAPVAQFLTDPTTSPNDGEFLLRATNGAAGTDAFDVYVTQPGVPLDNVSPNLTNVTYTTTTAFGRFIAGTYQLRLTLPNSKEVIYDGGTIPFNEGSSLWLVAYTKGSSTLVNAALLAFDATGSGAVVDSRLAQFKLVHAAPGTGPVNALVAGAVELANVPYLGASGYEPVASGPKTVTLEAVATPGATIASASPPFAPATDASIVLTGTPGAQTAVVLADTNIPATAGSARIRFGNMAVDVGPVDVYVNFVRQAAALPANAASGYVELSEDTYTVNFDIAGTTTVVLSVPQVSLTAGRTYSLFLSGAAGQYAAVLSRDD
jgi:hypothetical protein